MILKAWPPIARDIVLDAARYYYREMNDHWPVPDVIMERAIDGANQEFVARQSEIYVDASSCWINRWEHGKLDDLMRRAIEGTYRRLSRAEGALRARGSARKTKRQLDAAIAHALRRR